MSKSATQKEIQQQYRSLCLQLHPDKNREANTSKEDDFAFKEVQHAYSLIGTDQDRRKYDLMSRLKYSRRSTDSFGRSNYASDYPESFGSSIYFTFGQNGPSFRFYRNPSQFRRRAPPFHFHTTYSTTQQRYNSFENVATTKRMHYVQTVMVPLDILNKGGNVDSTLSPTIIGRYKAAYRGGILMPICSQAALTVVMTWMRSQKVNWALSLFLFATIVHANLPPAPMKKVYATKIKPGWKTGTKVKYQINDSDYASDVTFIIKEEPHDRFTRMGNDLHVTIAVRAKRLRRGCTVYIDPLCADEKPIKVKFRPGEVKEDGQVVLVEGRGWPRRCEKKACAFGDLLVKVRIKA